VVVEPGVFNHILIDIAIRTDAHPILTNTVHQTNIAIVTEFSE
jgi:hypothetical protein